MKLQTRWIPTALLAILVASASPASLVAQDRVILRRGSPVVGKVQSEDYQEVRIKARRGTLKVIPSERVADILRDGAPESYREGRVALQKGDLKNAEKLLQAAAVDSKETWVKEYATFYRAEALRAAGRFEEAVKAYEKVLSINAKSRFLPQVRLDIARALAAAGQRDKAMTALDAFVKEVNQKSLPERYSLDARGMLGRLFSRMGRHEEAAAAFAGVVRAAESLLNKAREEHEKAAFKEIILAAQRDLGTAYIKARKYSEAERTFSAIARQSKGDPRAQAVAAIGRAEAELGRGNADAARVMLTDVLAVHFSAEAELPRAMWLLAQAYEKLAEAGEKGARKRQRIYLRDLVEQYPGSDQAADARKILGTRQ